MQYGGMNLSIKRAIEIQQRKQTTQHKGPKCTAQVCAGYAKGCVQGCVQGMQTDYLSM